jgi:ABC-type sugar transport system permease subunit
MLQDPHFTEALRTTVLFTAASGSLVPSRSGARAVALEAVRRTGALAVAAFLPWVCPLVVVATFGRLALFGGVGPVGRAAGVPGGVLSALFLVPLAWVFWVNVGPRRGRETR